MSVSNLSSGVRPGVCTSTTRPTNPYEGFMIYETDTDLVYLWSGSAWVETVSALTKAPRGIMGYAISTANKSVTSTISDVTGMTVTFTAVANRLYKATFSCFYQQSDAVQRTFFTLADGSNVAQNNTIQTNSNNQGFNEISYVFLFTATAGSITRKMRASTEAGTATIFGAPADGRTYSFTIEDIGAA